ncbi:hypothetical protein D3C71_1325740 [compost metagenome]
MSTSVYPVVGRVRPDFRPELEYTTIVDGEHIKSPMPPPGEITPIDIQQTVQEPWQFVGVKEPGPADFEFSYPDKDCMPDHPQNVLTHMYDNYPLFSWLCDRRGLCQPRSDYPTRLEATERFIDWIGNTPGVKYVDFDAQKQPKETLREHYFDGFFSPIMFSIDELLAFNYDTIAQVHAGYDEKGNLYGNHPELKTWRECFDGLDAKGQSNGYFEFLAEAKAKGWGFIIFAFD